MFDTTNYLHYVLDSENDYHYTDDLMRLSSDAYLWHELKERHGFAYVVFIQKRDNGFSLEVFDTGSEQLLRWTAKKSIFTFPRYFQMSAPAQIRRTNLRLTDVKKQDHSLLDFILECQQLTHNEKMALVCSAETFEALYECSDLDGREQLSQCVQKKSSNAIMVIQLGMNADTLSQAFLDESCSLRKLDSGLSKALHTEVQKPLLTALSEQLGERLVDFSIRRNDMLNLLMYDAMECENSTDTLEQLKDQAEYLRLCCQYDLSIAYMLGSSTGTEPRRRSVILGKLKESTFRNALRSSANQLRQTNSEAPMEYLFRDAFSPLPQISDGLRVRYNDSLVKTVTALSLPEAYIQDQDTLKHVPEELSTAVQTLWNRSRNPAVCSMIEKCCGTIYSASLDSDWDTVTDALLLLQLCSRYLCADTVMQCNLDEVFKLGREVLTASSKYFKARNSFEAMEKLKKSGKTGSKIGHMQDYIHTATESTDLELEQVMLGISRSDLHQRITFFNMSTPTQKEVEDFFNERVKSQAQIMKDLQARKETIAQHQKSLSLARDIAQGAYPEPEEDTDPDFDAEEEEEIPDHSWRSRIGYRPPWESDPLLTDPEDGDDTFDFK